MMNNEEEGTVILDPELLAKEEEAKKEAAIKTEKMKTINGEITAALKELSTKHGMKILMGAFLEAEDEMGIWKSENINTIEEMGLVKLISNQF